MQVAKTSDWCNRMQSFCPSRLRGVREIHCDALHAHACEAQALERVSDILEQCLVAGCVLGVVRLEVCLIAGLLPWSSGKSERRKCSTLRKLIGHGRSQEY